MYTPGIFKHEDLAAHLSLMRDFPFATVITPAGGTQADEARADAAPFVSHLPILAERDASGAFVLTGHMARANPHWRRFAAPGTAGETLFIFHGPHTYVTPSWYKDPMNVPTWNYAVIHAHGSPRLIEDYEGIHRILDRTVQEFERLEPKPWQFSLPEDFKHELVGAIMGFEVRVSRIEAKYKLSQNRAPEDRAGVLEGLARRTDEMSRKTLALMKRDGHSES
jgi:transcriptional regulator